jgi:hypothetical protein
MLETSSAITSGTLIQASLVQNMNSGYTSGFNLLNESILQTATIPVRYYNSGGTQQQSCTNYYNVNSLGSVTVYPAPNPSSCTTNSILSALFGPGSPQGPISAQVNQIVLNTPKGSDYRAIVAPTPTVYVSKLFKNNSMASGLQIRNASGVSLNSIAIYYYDSSGSFLYSQNVYNIPPNGFTTVYPLPATVQDNSSAKIVSTSDQPLAVIVNHLKLNGIGDTLATYEGLNR